MYHFIALIPSKYRKILVHKTAKMHPNLVETAFEFSATDYRQEWITLINTSTCVNIKPLSVVGILTYLNIYVLEYTCMCICIKNCFFQN